MCAQECDRTKLTLVLFGHSEQVNACDLIRDEISEIYDTDSKLKN